MTVDQLTHDMLRAIRRIIRRVSQHSKAMSRETGMNVPQVVCLKAIGDMAEDGVAEVTIKLLSEYVQLSPATVSRIVERMVGTGLINRDQDIKDRRKVCLSLTPLGVARYQSLPTPLNETFVNRLLELDPDERVQLLASLERITELMDAADLDAAPLLTPGADVKSQ